MNQIIFVYKDYMNQSKLYHKKKILYLIIFFISIILLIIISIFILFNRYQIYKKNIETKKIMQLYNIFTLFKSSSNYSSLKLSNDIEILGLIEIPKIKISYPILSNSDKNLLKISVCRFSGPLPNQKGNLCIAGHNYKNTLMFSQLNKLNINDYIYISDINNNKFPYIIYDKYTSDEKDFNCTQNTKSIEITLITCSKNNNHKRLIIKAKMKET